MVGHPSVFDFPIRSLSGTRHVTLDVKESPHCWDSGNMMMRTGGSRTKVISEESSSLLSTSTLKRYAHLTPNLAFV